MDLLVIVNEHSDIVYSQSFGEVDEVDRCKLILLAYGSLDVIDDLVRKRKDNYFDCIDSYIKHDIAVLIFSSFYKAIFVTDKKNNIKTFLESVHKLFKERVLIKMIPDDLICQEHLDETILGFYKTCF